jgi:hypothetical protein
MRASADPHLAPVRDGVPLRRAPVAARPIVRSFEPGEPQRWCHADEPYV